MKDKTVLELATRLNEIEKQLNELEIEYNQIVRELWDRIPSVKDNANIQPKKRVKRNEGLNEKI